MVELTTVKPGVVIVSAPYDEVLKELRNQGYREISLEENALLRMQVGKDAYISRYGNRVREDVIYMPNKGAFLTKNPATSESPAKATKAQKAGKEFYPTKAQVEKSLEDSVQIPYGTESIPTNRFCDEEITVYAFGNQAEDYGEFLKDAGINEMPIWLVSKGNVNNNSKPFARKLWFDGVVFRSVLYSGFKDLDCSVGLLGVSFDAEGVAKIPVKKEPKEKEKLIYINPFEIDLPE